MYATDYSLVWLSAFDFWQHVDVSSAVEESVPRTWLGIGRAVLESWLSSDSGKSGLRQTLTTTCKPSGICIVDLYS